MSDHDKLALTASAARSELARLVEGLTARATPIDFADLERRGVLQKAKNERGWYLVLKAAELPAHAWQQTDGAGQKRVGNRFVPMLKFAKSTNKKAAAMLAQVERNLSRRSKPPR